MMYFAQRKKLEQFQASRPQLEDLERKVIKGIEGTLRLEQRRSESVKERDQEIEDLKRKYFLE